MGIFLISILLGYFCWHSEGVLFPFFPTNSAFGMIAAIALPLDAPHWNVFLSYNFEANYNFPFTWDIPPILNGIDDYRSCSNCTLVISPNNGTATERKRRSLLTRTDFYTILKNHIQRFGFDGDACLLRLICETNSSELSKINGVLGSIVHILFSPSTSMAEDLPLSYYQAELDGSQNYCESYSTNCEQNLLDLVSMPVHKIVEFFQKV